MWRNAEDRYGRISIAAHWLTAIIIVGLFGFGLWMVELTYYDAWYRTAPWLHKSFGILLFIVLVLRLSWRLVDPLPTPEPTLGGFERKASKWTHALLYLMLFGVLISGYLISTAKGEGIAVFGLFEVPATLTHLPNQADWAGEIHLILSIALIALASLHALAALKHHFIDRDRTLLRMLGRSKLDRNHHERGDRR